MKKQAYRIEAAFHNGLGLDLYGRLTDASARRISKKLDDLYARDIIKAFSIGKGSDVPPPQRMTIELSEEGLDAEIDRQILMLKDLPAL